MSASSTQPPADVIFPTNASGVARAAELLNAGGLVLLPTETVYGIGVNLSSRDARERVRRIKKALAGEGGVLPRWVIHVAQVEQALGWVGSISPLGRRLMTKALPGPVSFDVKLDAASAAAVRERLGDAADETVIEERITLRCPDFAATQDVLAAVNAPVAIVGAGTTAQPGIFEAGELPAILVEGEDRIEAVLDGGPTRYRKSSTLVKVDGEQFSVVRPGVIDERIIQRMADFTILFLCSGNTCRSPMAGAIASKMLAQRLGIQPQELPLRHIVVQSAGMHTQRGLRATMEAVDAVKSMGADLSSHQSQPVSADLLRRADVVYTMTEPHREEVMELYPWAARKTFRLDPDADIADPIGSSLTVYQRVAENLATVIQKRLQELAL